MRCPFCKEDSDRVIDSRSSEGGRIIRRRRQCLSCKRRFTTYERIEETVKLTVIKKDGSRVPYDRQKIVAGVQKSCYKRPVSMAQIIALTEDVEEQLFREGKQEISALRIGALTVERLRRLDRVAYIRYASVYRDFQDVNEFIAEANDVLGETIPPQGQQQLFDP